MAQPPEQQYVRHQSPTHHPKDEPWVPYEDAATETSTPFFRSLPNAYFRWRWMALWPFHRSLGKMPLLGYTSLGELLMLCIIIGVGAGWAAGAWGTISTGWVAIAYLAVAFALAGRNNLLTFLLGVSHERALFFHGVTATAATGLSLYHGIVSQLLDPEFSAPGAFSENMSVFVTGWVAFGLMATLVVTSASRVMRQYLWNTWQGAHWVMFIGTCVATAIHFSGIGLICAGIWVLDIAVRWLYMAAWKNPKEVEMVALPGNVIRLSWSAPNFAYSGGQYIYINVPGVSWCEFHPFSLSSSPGSSKVHVHVRVLGDWTSRLYLLAMKDMQPGVPKHVRAYIEGPFGTPSIDVYGERYKAFVMISGGIGVTPLQSWFNHLMNQRARGRPVKLAHLVWSVKDRVIVSGIKGFDEAFAATQLPSTLPRSFVPDLISPNLVAPPPGGHGHSHAAAAPGIVARQVSQRTTSVTSTATPTALDVERGMAAAALPPAAVDDFIATEFYLTQARPEDQHAQANIRPELQPALRFGRPDVAAILADDGARAAAAGETRVAVMVCGPSQLVAAVRAAAAQLSAKGPGVVYDVHAEVFEF